MENEYDWMNEKDYEYTYKRGGGRMWLGYKRGKFVKVFYNEDDAFDWFCRMNRTPF